MWCHTMSISLMSCCVHVLAQKVSEMKWHIPSATLYKPHRIWKQKYLHCSCDNVKSNLWAIGVANGWEKSLHSNLRQRKYAIKTLKLCFRQISSTAVVTNIYLLFLLYCTQIMWVMDVLCFNIVLSFLNLHVSWRHIIQICHSKNYIFTHIIVFRIQFEKLLLITEQSPIKQLNAISLFVWLFHTISREEL